MQITNQKHYKPSNPQDCMVKSIDSFLTCLDPHSNFLPPKTYKNILETTSGEFFGIGIVIDNTRKPADKALIVVDTIPDGPADKAGIQPFDKIIEIENKSLEGMTTDEATAKLKGEKNTKVAVKVLREGQPDLLTFEITRDVIKEQNSLMFYLEDHDIAYLSLNMFTENSVKQMTQLLKKAQSKNYNGIILDLRNNSGGLLTAAIDIVSLFVPKNSVVVSTKDKFDNVTEEYRTNNEPVMTNSIPIFILVNNYTASAAEILAGCLKIHSDKLSQNSNNKKDLMTFLVGTRSFGKGSVQEVIPVSNNSAIKITTSLYFLPDDSTIQGTGIEPDFVIERKMPPTDQMLWFNKYYGRENALQNYIKPNGSDDKKENKTENKEKKKTWSERAQEVLQNDNQFRAAISLINLFNTAKIHCKANVSNRQKAVEFMHRNYITDQKLNMTEIKN